MYVFPFEFLLVLRFALIGPVAQSQDAETIEIIRYAQHATDNLVGSGAVGKAATTHLYPARTQTKLFGLILHGDGGDGAIFYPTVVLHGIAKHSDGHRGVFKECTAHALGIGQLLEIHLIIYNHKLPSTLTLRGGRHQGGTEDELEVLGIDLLSRELAVTAAQLRQIFKTCHSVKFNFSAANI